MDIQDFTDLTTFVYGEFEKLSESCGVQNAPVKILKTTNTGIKKYINLYKDFLYRREKRQVIFQEALETMPHNWFWKLFHFKLNKQIKEYLSKNNQCPPGEATKDNLEKQTSPLLVEVSTPRAIVPPADEI